MDAIKGGDIVCILHALSDVNSGGWFSAICVLSWEVVLYAPSDVSSGSSVLVLC